MSWSGRADEANDLAQRASRVPESSRAAWIEEHTRGDSALASEVSRLVDQVNSSEPAPTETAQPAPTAHTANPVTLDGLTVDGERVSGRFGNYEVLGLIGRGGMGMVLRARQMRPQRDVALKLILDPLRSESSRRRFLREVEFLGRLEHPNIARIYDAGIHEGTPFFAMELINGETLSRYVATRKPGTEARLRLFAEVCDAVHYAHTKSLIHRDLKPGNILVFEPSGGGPARAKVLDFGVARATDRDRPEESVLTEVGQLIGTVPYMSPEQTAGDPGALDTRSDVYTLGVVLYELLTGRLPYAITNRPIGEMVRVVQQEDATRLSMAGPQFRGDLDTIVGKALEKDRQRRYQSASELAEDIRRYLRSEPIAARPASTAYVIRKFARRNKVLVGGVAATFVALLVGLGATLLALRTAVRAQKEAEVRADERDRAARFQVGMIRDVDTGKLGEDIVREIKKRLSEAGAGETERANIDSAMSKLNPRDLSMRLLRDHVVSTAADRIEKDFNDQPRVAARLWSSVGEIGFRLGDAEGAERWLRKAIADGSAATSPDDPLVLADKQMLGQAMLSKGRYREAEGVLRPLLEARRKVLGALHPQTGETMTALGEALAYLDQREEAESLMRRGIQIASQHGGTETLQTVSAVAMLVGHYLDAGELRRARNLLEMFPRLIERGPVADEPVTLTFTAYWAGLILEVAKTLTEGSAERTAQAVEAERLTRALLAIDLSLKPSDHLDVLSARAQIADALRVQGKFEDSLAEYQQVLQALERVGALREPVRVGALDRAGHLLLEKLNRPGEAVRMFAQLLAMSKLPDSDFAAAEVKQWENDLARARELSNGASAPTPPPGEKPPVPRP